MDGIVSVIANQIVVMFLIMALGFVFYRTKFIDDKGADQLSDIVLYVANPILIAQALMRDFDMDLLIGAGWVALLAAVTIGLAGLLGFVVYRDGSAHFEIGRFSMLFSNAGFIGIPLALATVGQDGVFYISVANTVQTALVWTYGVLVVSGDRREVAPKKVLLNPAILALVVGLVCFLASWQPPAVISQALDTLGSLNTGLVMLVLGCYLGQSRLGELLRDVQIYKVSVLRLLAMPLITLGVLLVLARVVHLDTSVQLGVLMYQAMPVAAVASLFAHKYDHDGDFATGAVAVTTLFSLVTLPFMMLLASLTL